MKDLELAAYKRLIPPQVGALGGHSENEIIPDIGRAAGDSGAHSENVI